MTVRRWANEQVANTNTSGSQEQSAVAATPDGGFVVVWTDNDVTGGDGSASSVKMQRFDINGAKVGAEALVNTTTFGMQRDPTVVVRDNGDIWVAWTDQSGAGGNGDDIRYRRFGSDGDPLDLNDRIATPIANNQSDAHLTIVSSGEVVLSFTSDDATNNVFAQRFNPVTGNTSGGLIAVANGGDDERESSIAALDDGFAAAWLDETVDLIFVRMFDDAGVETVAVVNASHLIDDGTQDPQVLSLGDRIVVCWTEGNDTELDDSLTSIRGQMLDLDGNEVGVEFQINTDPFGFQNLLSVTGTADGGFIVTYRSFDDVRGQLFDGLGARVGTEFIVNSVLFNAQTDPSMATLADGRIAITWTDFSTSGEDASNSAIHVQVFDPRDGYVTGTSAADTLLGNDFLNDEIIAFDGVDILNGRAGADNMFGGEGDDTYVVDNAGDRVNELFGGGTDAVVSFVSYALAANVENLTLIGAGKVNAAGNALANVLTGNGKANVLAGGLAKDTLIGGAGGDRFDFNAIADSVIGAGRDVIVGFSRAQKDRIDLSTIDADQRPGHAGNQAFVFIGTQTFAAHAGSGEVRRGAGGVIQINVDADHTADMQISVGIAVLAGDFIL